MAEYTNNSPYVKTNSKCLFYHKMIIITLSSFSLLTLQLLQAGMTFFIMWNTQGETLWNVYDKKWTEDVKSTKGHKITKKLSIWLYFKSSEIIQSFVWGTGRYLGPKSLFFDNLPLKWAVDRWTWNRTSELNSRPGPSVIRQKIIHLQRASHCEDKTQMSL